MAVFVHESAIVDEGATLGEGTRVWHFVHVSAGARIGASSVLGQNVFVGTGVRIGDRVKIQNNVSVYAGVEIEDEVFLGPSCVFTNVMNPRAHVERKDAFLPTRVERGASIGANATIVCGTTIGAYALVGAGAVVTRSVPAHRVVVGNPARAHGWACRCGELLGEGASLASDRCGDAYAVRDGVCTRLEAM